jgi:hypothetical protein
MDKIAIATIITIVTLEIMGIKMKDLEQIVEEDMKIK